MREDKPATAVTEETVVEVDEPMNPRARSRTRWRD